MSSSCATATLVKVLLNVLETVDLAPRDLSSGLFNGGEILLGQRLIVNGCVHESLIDRILREVAQTLEILGRGLMLLLGNLVDQVVKVLFGDDHCLAPPLQSHMVKQYHALSPTFERLC